MCRRVRGGVIVKSGISAGMLEGSELVFTVSGQCEIGNQENENETNQ